MEKIIYSRLMNELTPLNILPPFQFGFRKKYSTLHQLQRISEKIEEGFENKSFTATVFLDVAQAFDKVWLEGLKSKMIKLNISSHLKAIIFSFLENRTFAVRINSTISGTKAIKAGVPQGSVLGPLLFNIYTSDIPTINATLAIFADDTAILTQHSDLTQAILELQTAVDQICKWFKKWNIQINPIKCQAKIFSLRRIRNPPSIVLNNNTIQWNPTDAAVKYLGVLLDTRLTWKLHVNLKLNQSYARLAQLYPLINRKSTLKPKCAVLMYKSLIRPLALYASPIWSNTAKTNLEKLQRLQNKILRIAVDSPWYVRNVQLHYELSVPTVQDFISASANKFFKNIRECEGAVHYNLGRQNLHHRLKRKMPQDLYLSEADSD